MRGGTQVKTVAEPALPQAGDTGLSEPNVDIAVLDQRWEGVERLHEIATTAALCVFKQTGGWPGQAELAVVFSNDDHIRELNETFRGKARATNVLSFPASPPGGGVPEQETLLGDVILSFETITDEARAQGKTFENHLRHLIVHGVLHLLGYDHEKDAGARKMEALEISALAQIDVPNPY